MWAKKEVNRNDCHLQSMEHFEDIGPCVILASPGMMQNGLSRELFEAWCTDKRNGCIIAGYCVEGTLAKVCENGCFSLQVAMGNNVTSLLKTILYFIKF